MITKYLGLVVDKVINCSEILELIRLETILILLKPLLCKDALIKKLIF